MPTYEEILGGALMGDQEDGYAERLEDREANTSPYQDPPFYITAYGLALRAGFRGTLEEWLESLIGPKGEPAELRYDRERDMVQWKLPSENEWKDLLALADLQRGVIAATLETLQAAANGAEQAQQAVEQAKEAAITAKSEAEGAAGRAADSEANAGRSAASAENAKTAAEQAKTSAATSATNAESSAKSAATSANNASTSALSAESAKKAAEKAKTDAESAKSSAETSATSASNAASAAETAKDKAESAKTAAENAAIRQPILSDNNTWMIWDATLGKYVDTGISGVGPTGGTGPQGVRGHSILHTTSREIYSATVDGVKVSYRATLSDIKEKSSVDEVMVGDRVLYSYMHHTVLAVDDTYVYLSGYTSYRGADGVTPHIGENGNWFIGDTDTGVAAQGPKGDPGSGGSGSGGTAGKDGVTFTPSVSAGGVISWTNDGGLPNPAPVDITGPQGDKGDTGPQGESIANVTSYPDPLDADNNLIAFFLSTGQQVGIVGVRNGSKGDTGATGATGPAGADGKNGEDGADGKTPVKGEDYFTPADKAELVTAVLAALPVGEEATY